MMNARAWRWVVEDRRLLASVMREVRGARSVRAAAAATGISLGLWSILERGQRGRLAGDTARRLIRAAHRSGPPSAARELLVENLHRALCAPEQLMQAGVWDDWCVERASRWIRRAGPRGERLPEGASRPTWPEGPTLVWSGEIERWDALRLLRARLDRTSGRLQAFRDWCRQQRVPAEREWVSIVRVLEPLLEAEASGGFEPLKVPPDYLQHALAAERDLLKLASWPQ